MYSLDEVKVKLEQANVPHLVPVDFFYWLGWGHYLDGGILRISQFQSKSCEAAYFMGFGDAKGEDYGI